CRPPLFASNPQVDRRHAKLLQADRSGPRLKPSTYKPTRRHALPQANRLYATCADDRSRLSVPTTRYSRQTTDIANRPTTCGYCKSTASDRFSSTTRTLSSASRPPLRHTLEPTSRPTTTISRLQTMPQGEPTKRFSPQVDRSARLYERIRIHKPTTRLPQERPFLVRRCFHDDDLLWLDE
ncbi:hypothetical protein CPB85DRAFT_1471778, partial [Mucidula mucida]